MDLRVKITTAHFIFYILHMPSYTTIDTVWYHRTSQTKSSASQQMRREDAREVSTADVTVDVSGSGRPSGVTSLLSTSLAGNTQAAVALLTQNKGDRGIPLEAVKDLKPIDDIKRVALPETLEHKEAFNVPADPDTVFKIGDIVLGKHADHGDDLFAGMVMAPLATLFKDADADGDGQLTFEEWRTRLGKLVTDKELRSLFDECDKDKNGTLDLEEFTVGLAGKYEIKWAQEPQTDGIKDYKDLRLAPDALVFHTEAASQKEAKERERQQQIEQDKARQALEEAMRALQSAQTNHPSAGAACGLIGCVAIVGFACAMLLPILTIIFSQTFAWANDGAICSPDKLNYQCKCNQKFPVYMLITGILQIVFYLCLFLAFIGMASAAGSDNAGGAAMGGGLLMCAACCVGIPMFVINIMMWVFMFESDKECGNNLWGYGIFLIIVGVVHACNGRQSGPRQS